MTAFAVSPATPLVLLGGGAVISFLSSRAFRRGDHVATVTAIGALTLAFASFVALGLDGRAVVSIGEPTLRADGLAVFLGLVATGLGAVVAGYSFAYMGDARDRPLFAALLLLLVAGIAGIGLAGDLFSLYVTFELMAIASFSLVAFHRDQAEAIEAGMKYIVMSAAGSLVALFGIGLLYLGTGTLDLDAMSRASIPRNLGLLATGFLVTGFGVKAAIVPMHTWLPDAHAAAPSGVSAMLSGIVIQSALIAMVRALGVLGVGSGATASYGLLLALLAVLTMTVGNLVAMHQSDVKRLLAYSSVAQLGYILLGFGVGLEYGVGIALAGALFHILTHAIMKGGAFLSVGVLQSVYATRDLGALRGAGRRVPAAGVTFALFALGLAGVPPTAGFLSKLLIASGSALADGFGIFFVVALIANSILSLAYYVPALTGLLARSPLPAPTNRPALSTLALPVVLAGLLLGLGLWPDPAYAIVDPAVRALLGGD